MTSVHGVRIAVLASGTGTILSSLVEEVPVAVVLVDRTCNAQKIAEHAGIASEVVERSDFSSGFDRASYTQSVMENLERHEIDLVVLAGFGTVLSAVFFERYAGRVLNTHPSLLPSFKGWHAVSDALEAGVKITGCTVHIVTEHVDEGPILAQEPVRILDDDTEESLHERIKEVERRLYPATIRSVVDEWEGRET